MTDPADKRRQLLRPVAVAAAEISRSAAAKDPVPAGVRRLLRFRKLPDSALEQLTRVLERDADYRAFVASRLTDSTLSPALAGWLTRDEGWNERFDAWAVAEGHKQEQIDEIDQERREEQSVAQQAESAARLTERLSASEEMVDDLESRLQRSELRIAELVDAAEKLETENAGLSDRHAEALRQLEEHKAIVGRRNQERAELHSALEELRTAKFADHIPAAAPQTPPALTAALNQIDAALEDLREASRTARSSLPSSAASELQGSDSALSGPDGAAPASDLGAATAVAAPVLRRRAVPLPGGMRDDTTAAAEFLLGYPGIVVVVDGYNVTMRGWPEASVSEQRVHLVRVLENLAARFRCRFEVVFDGAEQSGPRVTDRDLGVRVVFSPPEVEADDIILAGAEKSASGEVVPGPLLVVSSDRRVVEGSARFGANTCSSDQLLALAGVAGG